MASEDFMQEYVEEVREHLRELEESLLSLEREGATEEQINQIFRAAHSIKGASAYMGFEGLASLTHTMESLISRIQDEPQAVSPVGINVLLGCVDHISGALAQLQEQGQEPILPLQLMDGLQGLLDANGRGAADSPANDTAPVSPAPEGEPIIEEEDEELFTIFLDSLREHFSTLAGICPCVENDAVTEPDIALSKDLIKRLIASSQYMDYDPIVEALRDADQLLDEYHRSGVLDGRTFAECVNSCRERLLRLLPTVELPQAGGAPSDQLPQIDILDEELEAALGLLNDELHHQDACPAPDLTAERGNTAPDTVLHSGESRNPEKAVLDADFHPHYAERPAAEQSPNPAEKSVMERAAISAFAEEAAPSATLRVDAHKVDQLLNQLGELVVTRSEFVQTLLSFREMIRELSTQGKLSKQELRKLRLLGFRLNESNISLGRITNNLQDSVMRVRMLPIMHLFQRFPRVVRDQALKLGKRVELVVEGADTEIDKRVLEQMYDPIIQFLRNAIAHGIEPPAERRMKGKPETGSIRLAAYHEGDYVALEIEDDGAGVDTDKLRTILKNHKPMSSHEIDHLSDQEVAYAIFLPGVSTRDRVDGSAGRGVGLDVVKENVERMNGSIEVESFPGSGARFTIRIPLTVAIIRALLVKSGDQVFTLPLSSVSEILKYKPEETHTIEAFQVISLRGRTIPLVHLSRLLNTNGSASRKDARFVVIVSTSFRDVGLVVDGLLGEREVVIKPIEDDVHTFDGFSGATVLGDGTVSLILDISALLRGMKESEPGS